MQIPLLYTATLRHPYKYSLMFAFDKMDRISARLIHRIAVKTNLIYNELTRTTPHNVQHLQIIIVTVVGQKSIDN